MTDNRSVGDIVLPTVISPTFRAMLEWTDEKDLFAAWLAGSMLKRRSQETYLGRVGMFLQWLRSHAVEFPDALSTESGRDAAVGAFRRYLEVERNRPASTVNTSLAALDHYFEWLGLGEALVPAMRRERQFPVLSARQRSRVLDEAAQRGAGRRASHRDHALLVTVLFTGLHLSEIAELDVDAIEFSPDPGRIRVPRLDGSEDRFVPLVPSVRRVLLQYRAERRERLGTSERRAFFLSTSNRSLSLRRIREIIDEVGAAAGVDDLSPGMLRRTYLHSLIENDTPLEEIVYLMGWSRPDLEAVRACQASIAGEAPKRQSRRPGRRSVCASGPEQLQIEFEPLHQH